MSTPKKDIAVIGAGITGTTAALMLAERGHQVHLIDKASNVMTGASLINEGKIHLGFVYVNDPSLRSLDVMVDTAVVFRSILERWIPPQVFEEAVTDTFDYIVPSDSLVSPEEIERKFALIAQKIEAAEDRHKTQYLGKERSAIWKKKSSVDEAFQDDYIVANYQTMERSIDTHLIAAALESCIDQEDRIELNLNQPISRIRNQGTKWRLEMGEKSFGPFDHIVNASWDGRPQLDEQVFGPDPVSWYHRYKHALILQAHGDISIPNFTAIIGTYGDVIKYPSGRVYLSHYPAGMLSASDQIEQVQTIYSQETKEAIAHNTIDGLSQFVPSIHDVFAGCQVSGDDVAGGIIMARGTTDIDDRESELHQRYKIGIQEQNGYMSIDTGKYTCGPAMAEEAVQQILN